MSLFSHEMGKHLVTASSVSKVELGCQTKENLSTSRDISKLKPSWYTANFFIYQNCNWKLHLFLCHVVVLYYILRVYKYTREHNQLIMTTLMTNEYTSLYKSLTVYFRKGDVCCVWEMSGDKDGLLYWPKFFFRP